MNSFNNVNNARNEPDARGVDASYVNQGCPMEGNIIVAPFRTSLPGIVHVAARNVTGTIVGRVQRKILLAFRLGTSPCLRHGDKPEQIGRYSLGRVSLPLPPRHRGPEGAEGEMTPVDLASLSDKIKKATGDLQREVSLATSRGNSLVKPRDFGRSGGFR